MTETRKLAAILAADMVGYSNLGRGRRADFGTATGAPERSDRSEHAVHHGRVVKRTGDGVIIEFRSVVDAVRCAIEVQNVPTCSAFSKHHSMSRSSNAPARSTSRCSD